MTTGWDQQPGGGWGQAGVKYEEFVDQFERVGKSDATGCMVSCPGTAHANGDRTPSLHVTRGDDGILLKCFAGCDNDEITRLLGLSLRDLYYEPAEPTHRVAFALGKDRLVDSYEYRSHVDNSVWMVVEKWRTADGKKTFKQRGPDGNYTLPPDQKPILYNLPEVVPHCQQGGEVWIAEGERDVETMRAQGLVATTNPMGAGKWRPYYWHWLQGARRVVVVADNDDVGRKHAGAIHDDLVKHGFEVSCVHARQGKDATDHFRWGHLAGDFVPWNPHRIRPLGVRLRRAHGQAVPSHRLVLAGGAVRWPGAARWPTETREVLVGARPGGGGSARQVDHVGDSL